MSWERKKRFMKMEHLNATLLRDWCSHQASVNKFPLGKMQVGLLMMFYLADTCLVIKSVYTLLKSRQPKLLTWEKIF